MTPFRITYTNLVVHFFIFPDFSSTGTPRRGPKIENITESNNYST